MTESQRRAVLRLVNEAIDRHDKTPADHYESMAQLAIELGDIEELRAVQAQLRRYIEDVPDTSRWQLAMDVPTDFGIFAPSFFDIEVRKPGFLRISKGRVRLWESK